MYVHQIDTAALAPPNPLDTSFGGQIDTNAPGPYHLKKEKHMSPEQIAFSKIEQLRRIYPEAIFKNTKIKQVHLSKHDTEAKRNEIHVKMGPEYQEFMDN